MSFTEKAVIMNGDEVNRAIKRMAHEVLEATNGTKDLVILGIHRRGVPLAGLLCEAIKGVEGVDVPNGAIDITFYRDDLSKLGPSPRVAGLVAAADPAGALVVASHDKAFLAACGCRTVALAPAG